MWEESKSSTGAVFIEAAIALPVLVLLLLMSIELGNALSAKITITYVARDVARVAANMDRTDPELCDVLIAEARARLAEDIDVEIYNGCPLNCACPFNQDALFTDGIHPENCDDKVTIMLRVADPPTFWKFLNVFTNGLQSTVTTRHNNGNLCFTP